MTQTHTLINSAKINDTALDAGQISALTHEEAGALAREELNRFLAVVESLSGADWQQPTDCTEWSVRDILAHQAGSYASNASWAEFMRQGRAKPGPGQLKVDAINARQLADRADRSPAELISELRRVGPRAINVRQGLPRLLRKLRIPFGPPLGTTTVEYLTDLIFTRDTWSHRMDICRATSRPFTQTPEHDGRQVALVMRDLAQKLPEYLGGQSVIFDLSGPAGGRYRIDQTREPSAIIKMDMIQFSRLASDRITQAEAKAQSLITISGDHNFADQVLARISVPY